MVGKLFSLMYICIIIYVYKHVTGYLNHKMECRRRHTIGLTPITALQIHFFKCIWY